MNFYSWGTPKPPPRRTSHAHVYVAPPDADAPARSLYDTVLDLALTRTTKDDALEADDYAAEPIHDPGSTLKEAPKRAAAAKPLTALVSAARGIDTGPAACVTARALRRRPADRRMISAMALAAEGPSALALRAPRAPAPPAAAAAADDLETALKEALAKISELRAQQARLCQERGRMLTRMTARETRNGREQRDALVAEDEALRHAIKAPTTGSRPSTGNAPTAPARQPSVRTKSPSLLNPILPTRPPTAATEMSSRTRTPKTRYASPATASGRGRPREPAGVEDAGQARLGEEGTHP